MSESGSISKLQDMQLLYFYPLVAVSCELLGSIGLEVKIIYAFMNRKGREMDNSV